MTAAAEQPARSLTAVQSWDGQDQGYAFWVEDADGNRVVGDQLETVNVAKALFRLGYVLDAPFTPAGDESGAFTAPCHQAAAPTGPTRNRATRRGNTMHPRSAGSRPDYRPGLARREK